MYLVFTRLPGESYLRLQVFVVVVLRISSAYYLPCVLVPSNAMDKTAYSGNLPHTFTPVTEQFVLEILQKTVPRSCDLDPIPTKLLYEILGVLLPTITNIIITSLASGPVPPDFKGAIVKPLLGLSPLCCHIPDTRQ